MKRLITSFLLCLSLIGLSPIQSAVATGILTQGDWSLVYPDFSKVFEIYTDASSKQLGAVITQDKTLPCTMQIQCHQNWTTSHSRNIKRVQRDAVGPKADRLYWPSESHARCTWVDIWPSVSMEINTRRIWSLSRVHQGDSQHSGRCHLPVEFHPRSTSTKRRVPKLDDVHETLLQVPPWNFRSL